MNDISEIRHRLGAVSQTRQITRAMQLISTSKMKTGRQRHDANMAYHDRVGSVIADILAMSSGNITHPFIEHHRGHRAGYLVIAGDKGLAGGYNHNVMNMAIEHMQDRPVTALFSVGHVGRDALLRAGFELDVEYLHIIQNPQLYHAREIAGDFIDMFEQGALDEVWVVYTHMINMMSFEPRIHRILPIRLTDLPEPSPHAQPGSLLYQPTPEDVLARLVPQYIVGEVYSALIQSYASEHSARMQAMDSSTRNATEMIDKLTLSYNRARQAAITQEITEIIAATNPVA